MQTEYPLDFAQVLDRGLVRQRNEDRAGIFIPDDPSLRAERGRLFVVADGMGGHAAGDVAAEITVRTLQARYFTGGWQGAEAALTTCYVEANAAILRAAGEGGREGMGAASVAIALTGTRGTVAHLGDCRAYLIRGGALAPLTRDHSWVAERMRTGGLTDEEARVHPYRNVLTRALGADPHAEPEVSSFDLLPGDALLLCSDGLWGLVEDAEIAGTLPAALTADAAVRALADLALGRGAHDNLSAIVVRVLAADGTSSVPESEIPTVQIDLATRPSG